MSNKPTDAGRPCPTAFLLTKKRGVLRAHVVAEATERDWVAVCGYRVRAVHVEKFKAAIPPSAVLCGNCVRYRGKD